MKHPPNNAARFVSAPGLFAGAPYEYAAIAPDSALVFTAGACPIDAEGRTLGAGDFEAQARQAIGNLFAALASAGAGPASVLKTTVYVVSNDRAALVRVWDVVAAAFAPARPPATLLGVAALGYPDQLVEIEAVAAVPRD